MLDKETSPSSVIASWFQVVARLLDVEDFPGKMSPFPAVEWGLNTLHTSILTAFCAIGDVTFNCCRSGTRVTGKIYMYTWIFLELSK